MSITTGGYGDSQMEVKDRVTGLRLQIRHSDGGSYGARPGGGGGSLMTGCLVEAAGARERSHDSR